MHGRSTERILIVEDDPIVGEMMRATLTYCGYACEIATTAASALDRLRSGSPDAITVDLGLPDGDGLELVSVLHCATDTPLIVVSGRSSEADKIAALDSGADDYIVKPFLPGELVARIKAKLRLRRTDRPEVPDNPYEVDQETEGSLSRMERGLLALLIKHQGETVSENEIIASLWGSEDAAASADLRSLVLKLRRKLQLQRQPLFVLNERGVGYYISGFGRFSRHQRGTSQLDRKTAPSAPQAVPLFPQDVAAQSASSGPSALFSQDKADLNSEKRARQ